MDVTLCLQMCHAKFIRVSHYAYIAISSCSPHCGMLCLPYAVLCLLCHTKPTICYIMPTINKTTILHIQIRTKSTPETSLAVCRVESLRSWILLFLIEAGVPVFKYRSECYLNVNIYQSIFLANSNNFTQFFLPNANMQ